MTFALKEVSFRYPKADRFALRGVRLEIAAGTTTAVVGLSGSGKTTLLSLLGLLWDRKPAEGEITYTDGKQTWGYARLPQPEKARLRREHFGFVLQSSYLLPHFTCAQNVGIPLALRGVSPRECRERVEDLLREADEGKTLYELRDRSAREVSGGERQRMAVLRAVIHQPRVLFADEPLSNLDFRNADRILDLLKRWQAGVHPFPNPEGHPRSLLLISHNVELAYEVAEQFVLLKQGEVVGGRVLNKRADLPGGPARIRSLVDYEQKEPSPCGVSSSPSPGAT